MALGRNIFQNQEARIVPAKESTPGPRSEGQSHQEHRHAVRVSQPTIPARGIPNIDAEGEAWEDPAPIQAVVPSIPFPTGAFPESVARFIRSAARSLSVDEASIGSMVLVVLSAATVGRVRVKGFGSHVERTALWVLIVAEPGERKTAVFSVAKAPLVAVEDKLREDALVGRQAAEGRLSAARTALKRAESDLAAAYGDADDEAADTGEGPISDPPGASADEAVEAALKKLNAASERVASLALPDLPKLTASDVTPEKLHDIMAAQDGRLALFIPEGQSLLHRISNGGNGSDLEPYLDGHAGDTMDRDRVTREVDTVKDPSLVLAVMTQPEVFANKATDEMRWSGFLDRFFIVRPRSLAGSRPARTPEIDPHVGGAYSDTVARMVREFWPLTEPRFLTLSEEAAVLYEAAFYEVEARLTGDQVPGNSAGWAKKMVGALLRVAGTLAVAEDAGAAEIQVQHVRAGIDLMRFFQVHAETVNRTLMSGDEGKRVERAVRVLEVLARFHAAGRSEVTIRDIVRRRHGATNADIHAHLTALAGLGWVLPKDDNRTGSAVWVLHPGLSQWAEKFS